MVDVSGPGATGCKRARCGSCGHCDAGRSSWTRLRSCAVGVADRHRLDQFADLRMCTTVGAGLFGRHHHLRGGSSLRSDMKGALPARGERQPKRAGVQAARSQRVLEHPALAGQERLRHLDVAATAVRILRPRSSIRGRPSLPRDGSSAATLSAAPVPSLVSSPDFSTSLIGDLLDPTDPPGGPREVTNTANGTNGIPGRMSCAARWAT
jgi:hypothetical protein